MPGGAAYDLMTSKDPVTLLTLPDADDDRPQRSGEFSQDLAEFGEWLKDLEHQLQASLDLVRGVQAEYGLVETSTILDFPTLAEVKVEHVRRALRLTADNKAAAARLLGVNTKTVYNVLYSWDDKNGVAG